MTDEEIKEVGRIFKAILLATRGDKVYELLDPCTHCPHFDIDTFTCDNPNCEED